MKKLFLIVVLTVICLRGFTQIRDYNDLILLRVDNNQQFAQDIEKMNFFFYKEDLKDIYYFNSLYKVMVVKYHQDGTIVAQYGDKYSIRVIEDELIKVGLRDNTIFKGNSATNRYWYLNHLICFEYNDIDKQYRITVL